MKNYIDSDLLDKAVIENKQNKNFQKIIFLDIDGVLHDFTTDGFVKQDCIQRLKQITDATGAELVLASSWRFGYPEFIQENHLEEYTSEENSSHLQYFQQLMKQAGLKLSGFTPYSQLWANSRPLEIRRFLLDKPCTRSFVILDDEDYDWQWLREFLVQTRVPVGIHEDGMIKYRYGLNDSHVEKAIKILNRFD